MLGLPDSNPPARSQRRNVRQSSLIKAEIVATDTSLFVLKFYNRSKLSRPAHQSESGHGATGNSPYYLMVHYFGNTVNPGDFDTISDYLVKEFSVELTPWYYQAEEFDNLKEEGRVSTGWEM